MNQPNAKPGEVNGEVIAKSIIAGLAIDVVAMTTLAVYHSRIETPIQPTPPSEPALINPNPKPIDSTLI